MHRPLGQGIDQRCHLAKERRPAIAHVEPQVERDLIVARASRMKSRGDGAEPFAELRLDRHVHVFLTVRQRERPRARLVVEGA